MNDNDIQTPKQPPFASVTGSAPSVANAETPMVQLCSKIGRVYKGDMVPLGGGLFHVRRMREENEREQRGHWREREWWLEDGNGNRINESETPNAQAEPRL